MKDSVYDVEAEIEKCHWWFVGRRFLFRKQMMRHSKTTQDRVLDIGCGTGSNLRLLRDRGFQNYIGLDSRENALMYCSKKGFGRVVKGDACALPFQDGTFDFILATDVIEHIDDDALTVREIARVLKSDGKVLITVPTFQSLWGVHDDLSEHKRRYVMPELRSVAAQNGLIVIDSFYFNFFLFLPIWLARKVVRRSGIEIRSENEINSPAINSILKLVFKLDVALAPKIQIPFGVSALCLCRRTAVD